MDRWQGVMHLAVTGGRAVCAGRQQANATGKRKVGVSGGACLSIGNWTQLQIDTM